VRDREAEFGTDFKCIDPKDKFVNLANCQSAGSCFENLGVET
jgi:hypothetical protein